MRAVIISAVFACAFNLAIAETYIARNGSDYVELTNSICPAEVSRHFERLSSRALGAIAHLEGKTYKACWVASGSVVELYYDDGDTGLVPRAKFKKSEGA